MHLFSQAWSCHPTFVFSTILCQEMPSLKRIKISMEKSFLAQKNMVIILAGNHDEGDEGHKILEEKREKQLHGSQQQQRVVFRLRSKTSLQHQNKVVEC